MTEDPKREELGRRDMLLRSTAIAATAALASSTAAQPTFAQAQAQGQPQARTQAQSQKPNVVFILADNVGYGDLGCYGGGELRGAPTPRLDQLAREGCV